MKRVFTSERRKRIFIVHGWTGYPNEHWLPWAKKQLENLGYEVKIPAMPDTDNPKIETWIPFLATVVGSPQKTDVFIGHSIGCSTILRFLETLSENQKVDKVILVAPWAVSLSNLGDDEDQQIAKPWLETPINFEKVKNKTNDFISIFSDNDPYVPLEENIKVFEEKLGAKIIVKHNKGHFLESDGVTELSDVADAIMSVEKNE